MANGDSLRKWTRNIPRKASWLMPGLSFKRWISVSFLGFFCVLLGLALIYKIQPVSSFIRFLEWMATIMPSHISGPLMLLLGGVLVYLGTSQTYHSFFHALTPDGRGEDLLEALYRRNKLSHGPQVVAVGGGTGLATLLRGIKRYTLNITAIVTVGDDGGSSGRLRREYGIIPPGDIRNCIAALADEEQLITSLFQYRFRHGQGLEGHSFGNLFLSAMCHITGDMFSAIKESSKVLNIRGRVLPSTLEHMSLRATLEDGTVIEGESDIPKATVRIDRLTCDPAEPKPLPDVLDAIAKAELIVLGPGSLYTSVIPNLLIPEIAKAISQSTALKVYVVNVMTQPGETNGYTVGDHVQAILDHAPFPNMIDAVIVNSGLPKPLVQAYEAYDYRPVVVDTQRCDALGVAVVNTRLVEDNEEKVIRHNPRRLARAVIHWFKRESRHRSKIKPSSSALPIDMPRQGPRKGIYDESGFRTSPEPSEAESSEHKAASQLP